MADYKSAETGARIANPAELKSKTGSQQKPKKPTNASKPTTSQPANQQTNNQQTNNQPTSKPANQQPANRQTDQQTNQRKNRLHAKSAQPGKASGPEKITSPESS